MKTGQVLREGSDLQPAVPRNTGSPSPGLLASSTGSFRKLSDRQILGASSIPTQSALQRSGSPAVLAERSPKRTVGFEDPGVPGPCSMHS